MNDDSEIFRQNALAVLPQFGVDLAVFGDQGPARDPVLGRAVDLLAASGALNAVLGPADHYAIRGPVPDAALNTMIDRISALTGSWRGQSYYHYISDQYRKVFACSGDDSKPVARGQTVADDRIFTQALDMLATCGALYSLTENHRYATWGAVTTAITRTMGNRFADITGDVLNLGGDDSLHDLYRRVFRPGQVDINIGQWREQDKNRFLLPRPGE